MKTGKARWGKLFGSNRGSTSLIIICTTIVVILLSAVVTDIGFSAYSRIKLAENAKLVAQLGAEALAENRSDAVALMKKAAVKNMDDLNSLDIRLSDNDWCITVSMGKPIRYVFLKFIGIHGKQLSTTITAKLSNASSFKGVRPFVLEKQKLAFEKTVILTSRRKDGKGYIPFSAMNPGKDDMKTSVIYGYRNRLHVGNGIRAADKKWMAEIQEALSELLGKENKEPVNQEIHYTGGNNRILVLPVVDKLVLSTNESMKVAGFAVFYLQSWETVDGDIRLKGRFIRYSADAGTSDSVPYFGLTGVRMYH
jgi:hypothetical protein